MRKNHFAGKTGALVFVIGFGALNAVADDYPVEWSHSVNCTLNTTSTGAYVAGNVVNFPAAIRLDAGAFPFEEADSLGKDIRFAKSDGTHLPYQIEYWSKPDSEAAIWVLIDTVYGNAKTQYIKMHWGNTAAADSSSPNQVFRISDGYSGVWHLSEAAPDSRANSVQDSFIGAPASLPPDKAKGLIGKADSISGQSQYIQIPSINFAGPATVEVWVYPTAFIQWGRIFAKGWETQTAPWLDIQFQTDTSGNCAFNIAVDSATVYSVGSNRALTPYTWSYLVGTFDGTSMSFYINGALQGTANGIAKPIYQNTMPFYLAKDEWSENQGIYGKLDEARISQVASSADWIKLNYAGNQPGSRFLAMTDIMKPPSKLKYAYDTTTVIRTVAYPRNEPTWIGVVNSFIVDKALPAGLTLDAQTGVISGTPTAVSPAADYVIIARNVKGYTAATITITVNEAPPAPSDLRYPKDTLALVYPMSPTGFIPTVTGVADSFTISPALNNGLAIDSRTGEIIGTTWFEEAPATYVVTAWNMSGTATDTITISIGNTGTKAVSARKWSFGLQARSLSSASSGLLLQFSVPETRDISSIRFTRFDLAGHKIGERKVVKAVHAGINFLPLTSADGMVQRGASIIEMKVFRTSGQTLKFAKRIIIQ